MSITVKEALNATAAAVASDAGLAHARFGVASELVGVTAVDVRVGDATVKIDQPQAIGGTGLAPTPAEFALAALGSCQAHVYRFWSEKLGIAIDHLSVDVRGDLDIRGVFGLADGVRPGFSGVEVDVSIEGPESPERYHELRELVNEHCPVLDVFTGNVPVRTSLAAT